MRRSPQGTHGRLVKLVGGFTMDPPTGRRLPSSAPMFDGKTDYWKDKMDAAKSAGGEEPGELHNRPNRQEAEWLTG